MSTYFWDSSTSSNALWCLMSHHILFICHYHEIRNIRHCKYFLVLKCHISGTDILINTKVPANKQLNILTIYWSSPSILLFGSRCRPKLPANVGALHLICITWRHQHFTLEILPYLIYCQARVQVISRWTLKVSNLMV